jgi:hypothetical protein
LVTRFEPRKGLDEEVARRIVAPRVRRALDMLTDSAQAKAPDVKVWVTMRDERVRPSHFTADTQTIPANLRFRLDAADGGTDLAREPRDPNLPIAQRANCRCDAPHLPHVLAESIHATDVQVMGTRVDGSVETRFPRAAESEFGTTEDEAAHFMTNALHEVALRLRSSQAR